MFASMCEVGLAVLVCTRACVCVCGRVCVCAWMSMCMIQIIMHPCTSSCGGYFHYCHCCCVFARPTWGPWQSHPTTSLLESRARKRSSSATWMKSMISTKSMYAVATPRFNKESDSVLVLFLLSYLKVKIRWVKCTIKELNLKQSDWLCDVLVM